MNTLKSLRAGIASPLRAAGFRVEEFIPEQIRPPLAILEPGSPYLESGDTFGSYRARFSVALIAAKGTNEVATAELDQALCEALVVLDNTGWGIERVTQPAVYETGGAHYLFAIIEVVSDAPGIDDGGAGEG